MLAPFHQFMTAQARDIERKQLVNESYRRTLTEDELQKLTEEQRASYRRRRRIYGPSERPEIRFDYYEDMIQGDYDQIDSRQRYEFGE